MVILSIPARVDLRQIHDYISQTSKHYAREVVQSIIGQFKSIGRFPRMGRVVPEIQDENIREILIYSYRVVYRISKNDAEIAAIIHAKRDFKEAMKDRIPTA